jgi:hypothetical protein
MAGTDVHFEAADVSRMNASWQRVQTAWPGQRAINGAGITATSLRKMTATVARGNAVNLDSVFNLCRLLADGMCERGFGRIVNISSIIGQTGASGTMLQPRPACMAHHGACANSQQGSNRQQCQSWLHRHGDDGSDPRCAGRSHSRRPDWNGRGRGHAIAFLCAEQSGYLTGSTCR